MLVVVGGLTQKSGSAEFRIKGTIGDGMCTRACPKGVGDAVVSVCREITHIYSNQIAVGNAASPPGPRAVELCAMWCAGGGWHSTSLFCTFLEPLEDGDLIV